MRQDKPMTVLVTGGAGTLGSAIAAALIAAGHDVVILDDFSGSDGSLVPRQARVMRGNAGDRALVGRILDREQVAAIVHAAACNDARDAARHPARCYRGNVAVTIDLADTAASARIGTFLLSVAAAGEGGVLGRSKAMAETILLDMASVTGMALGIIRHDGIALDAIAADHVALLHTLIERGGTIVRSVGDDRAAAADPAPTPEPAIG